jgi:hypothetical protein
VFESSPRLLSAGEVIAGIAFLGWRSAHLGTRVLTDAIAAAVCLWLISRSGSTSRATRAAMVSGGAYLLCVYASGQALHTLRLLGLAP